MAKKKMGKKGIPKGNAIRGFMDEENRNGKMMTRKKMKKKSSKRARK